MTDEGPGRSDDDRRLAGRFDDGRVDLGSTRPRRSVRAPRLGTAPVETSAAFQVVPTALSLLLAFVLLLWYASLQRQARITPDLDRLESVLDGGAVPANRSVVEAACVEVQRVEAEVAPLTWAMGSLPSGVRRAATSVAGWVARASDSSLVPWLDVARVRDAAHGFCDGARFAARAASVGPIAVDADVAASRAAFGAAVASLAAIEPGSFGHGAGLSRIGVRLEEVRAFLAADGIDAAALTALSLAAGPTVDGTGRGTAYLIVARAHLPDGSPDAVAIARMTVRDGVVGTHRVLDAATWEGENGAVDSDRRAVDLAHGVTVPAPEALTQITGSAYWHVADADWWVDFRRVAVQLLRLWQAAGHDASAIDGIVEIDAEALPQVADEANRASLGASVPADARAMVVARLGAAIDRAVGDRRGSAALARSMARAADTGAAVMWSRDPAVQAVIEARGWAGEARIPDPDEVSVVLRATRGPRAVVMSAARSGETVHVEGPARVRLVVASEAPPVTAVIGAAGPVTSTREGRIVVLEVPVGPGAADLTIRR